MSNNPFIAASMTHLLVEIFLFMHPAILPTLMREFNITIIQAGLILTVPSIIRLSLNIPSGTLTDRIGSHHLLTTASALSGFGSLIVSQSPDVFFLVVGLCILMMAVTLYHPPGLSIISKMFSRGELTKMIGVHGATGSIGQGLGIISASLMILTYGWRSCYLLWSIVLFGWSLILIKLPIPPSQWKNQPSVDEFDESNRESLSDACPESGIFKMVTAGSFPLLLLVMSIIGLANQATVSFTTTYFVQMRNLPEELSALIFGLGPLTGVLGSLIGGYLGSRFGDREFLSLAFFGLAFFVFGLAYAQLIGIIIAAFLLYRWLSASTWPASVSLVSTLTSESSRGVAYSLFFLLPGIAGAAAPIIGAMIIEMYGILSIFQCALVLCLSGSVMVLLIKD